MEYKYSKFYDPGGGVEVIARESPKYLKGLVFRTTFETDGEGVFKLNRILAPLPPIEERVGDIVDVSEATKDDWDLYMEIFKKELSKRVPIKTRSSCSTSDWDRIYTDGFILEYRIDLSSKYESLSLSSLSEETMKGVKALLECLPDGIEEEDEETVKATLRRLLEK